MTYLLDTHTLIWAIVEKKKLSAKVKIVLEDVSNTIFVSSICFLEISLKFSLGKLDLQGFSPEEIPALVTELGFDTIDLKVKEAATYHQLAANHHRDPFDRMLIWQAIQNNFILISNDANMPYYKQDGLRLLW